MGVVNRLGGACTTGTLNMRQRFWQFPPWYVSDKLSSRAILWALQLNDEQLLVWIICKYVRVCRKESVLAWALEANCGPLFLHTQWRHLKELTVCDIKPLTWCDTGSHWLHCAPEFLRRVSFASIYKWRDAEDYSLFKHTGSLFLWKRDISQQVPHEWMVLVYVLHKFTFPV